MDVGKTTHTCIRMRCVGRDHNDISLDIRQLETVEDQFSAFVRTVDQFPGIVLVPGDIECQGMFSHIYDIIHWGPLHAVM